MRRQTSTSIVDRPVVPSTRITPNDVNVNMNTIAAAAASAGRNNGSVTSRNVVIGPAPNVAAACSRSAGSCSQTAPTVRTTTARLNTTWAPRIAHTLRSSELGNSATMAAPTTTVGSTNTAVSTLRNARRPGKLKRAVAHVGASPSNNVSNVLATACHKVNHNTRQVSVRANVSEIAPTLIPRHNSVANGHT